MTLPQHVKLVEVGPRDGLQNETQIIPTASKIEFIHRLVETGLTTIEVTSFVSPKRVPQLADHDEVLRNIKTTPAVSYPVLVPNIQGLQAAMDAGAKDIAVFAAATETFSQKNINCSIAESLQRFSKVITMAKKHRLKVRGYLSCVLECPYEGAVDATIVAKLAGELYAMGCYEISLGDTIGAGTPGNVQHLIKQVLHKVPLAHCAVHFHDTYGQALANIFAALQCGIHIIDSSVAGLGGCPYAPGAAGNVASEDVLYMLNGLGITSGVDLAKLCDVAWFISDLLQREPNSKVALANRKK